MKRWMKLVIFGVLSVGCLAVFSSMERKKLEVRELLSEIRDEEIASKFREDMAKAQREYDEGMAQIEARSKAWKSRDEEDKRMKETLPQGEYFKWRVERNEAESASAAAAEKRKTMQLQEDQLKELREINEKLGK